MAELGVVVQAVPGSSGSMVALPLGPWPWICPFHLWFCLCPCPWEPAVLDSPHSAPFDSLAETGNVKVVAKPQLSHWLSIDCTAAWASLASLASRVRSDPTSLHHNGRRMQTIPLPIARTLDIASSSFPVPSWKPLLEWPARNEGPWNDGYPTS